jgi:hypothetical protein
MMCPSLNPLKTFSDILEYPDRRSPPTTVPFSRVEGQVLLSRLFVNWSSIKGEVKKRHPSTMREAEEASLWKRMLEFLVGVPAWMMEGA